MLSCTCLMTLLLAASAAISALATTYHVPGQYPTIQSGIDAASYGDTVLVECGTYYEHDIVMKSGILLLSETGEADCATIDAQEEGRVLYCENVSQSTLIKGFTLTGGRLYLPDPDALGGGVYCGDHSSPTIESCTIRGNDAGSGGGIYCDYYSSPTIKSCVIGDNGASAGGGMYCTYFGSPTLTGVTFEYNGSDVGGGLYCELAPSLRLTDCAFIGNSACEGTGMYCLGGSFAVLERVIFDSNVAACADGRGGAMFCNHSPATLIDVSFSGNWGGSPFGGLALFDCTAATLTRVTFVGNWGEVASVYFSGCSPSVTSCTFYGNHGSLLCGDGASPTLERTIMAFSTYGPAISCDDPSSQPVLECCDIFGNAGGDWVGCIEDQYGINGNISEDPLFCDPENGDFTLDEDSPCAPLSTPNEGCDLVGAWPVGCGPPTATQQATWGQIKALFHR